jgi:alpha-glucoside transport system substrate-binding protein
MLNKRKVLLMGLLLAVALILAGCGGGTEDTPADVPAEEDGEADSGDSLAIGECPAWVAMTAELEAACDGELAGMTVSMAGPFTDEDEMKFRESVAPFEQWTGITIQYTGTKEFETIITDAVQGGTPPDMASFSQPGLLRDFARDGQVIDVNTFMNAEWLEANYRQSWRDMATMPGPNGDMMAGIWARYNGKSQVWYPKQAWDAAGYQIPQTWDEMLALSDQIVAEGGTPWCIGIESGGSTGWPATDWMEDIMLRTTSLENYDAWSFPDNLDNRLHFTSPEVRHAAGVMSKIWMTDAYVYGGVESIVETSFSAAPAPMFENPPGCWMHKQSNFITSYFPPGSQAGVDYDFFTLPPIDPAYGRPYLVAGDIYAMFNDRPEVRAVMDYFSRGESLRVWLGSGGTLSPHNDAGLDWYGNPIERRIAEEVAASDVVRFDGSDLMPGVVGAGTFWKGMTDYIGGEANLDTVLAEIDSIATLPPGTATLDAGPPLDALADTGEGAAPPLTAPNYDPEALKVLVRLNGWRIAEGLAPFRIEENLTILAQEQATYLASLQTWPDNSHRDANGAFPPDRALGTGWPTYNNPGQINIGENVYLGTNADVAVEWWRNSSLHSNTVLQPAYREIGVAAAPHPFGFVYVTVFGGRPDVLPALLEPGSGALYLSTEQFKWAPGGDWVVGATHYQFVDTVDSPADESAWMPFQGTVAAPDTDGHAFYVVLSDGVAQTTTAVRPWADVAWLGGNIPAGGPAPVQQAAAAPATNLVVSGINPDVPLNQRKYHANFAIGNWISIDENSATVTQTAEGYEWIIRVDGFWINTDQLNERNFYAQTIVDVGTCPPEAGFGLRFRLADAENFYQYSVWCDDTFSVLSRIDGELGGPYIPQTPLPQNLTGQAGQTRTLGVMATAEGFTLYLDGEEIGSSDMLKGEYSYGDLPRGDIGITAVSGGDGTLSLVFKVLEVYALN